MFIAIELEVLSSGSIHEQSNSLSISFKKYYLFIKQGGYKPYP